VLKFLSQPQSNCPLIVAHRGASKARHENTLEAFEAAIEMGADAVEFDVRRTRDNAFVIYHDPSIKGCDTLISHQSLDKAQKAARRAGFDLPTLEKTLSTCSGKIGLDIELKEAGYEEQVLSFIRQRVDPAAAVVTSFIDDSVRRTKSLWPEVKTGLILGVDPPASIRTRLTEFFPERRLKASGADFVVPHFRLLKFGFMKRMSTAGYPVWVWTVADVPRSRSLAVRGVAAIITVCPDLIRAAMPESDTA
jgi:glycerophosphoryl diester phosphodiesterase